jgi:hypothetical protein
MATKVDFYSTYGLKIDQSATGDNTLSVDYINNKVGIGMSTNSPRVSLDLGYTSDALIIPTGNNSSQRPGTPVLGMMRYNSTDGYFEGYDSFGWSPLSKPSISNIVSSTSTFYVPFVGATSGSLQTIYTDSNGITYQPSTNTLTIPTLSVTSNTTIGGNLTVTGNATITGKLIVTDIDEMTVTTLSTSDNFIELGKINNAIPTSDTTYELGLAFNYFASSAKQSALIWQDNTGFVFASEATIPNTVQDSGNPQAVASVAAPIAANSVYIGTNFSSPTNQVIDSSKNLINVAIDCGSF